MKKNKKLELRMYYLCMYNISDIQKSIQALHATVEYQLKHGNSKEYLDWAKNHKTVIIYNGGTSNEGSKSVYGEPVQLGSMENHFLELKKNKIKCAAFYEPDLNHSLSSIAFLVDERVYNKKDFPDINYSDFNAEKLTYKDEIYYTSKESFQDGKEQFALKFSKKVGKDVFFLKEFLKKFRFA